MYEAFYGLAARPFDLTSNPRSLFLTDKYREALSHVQYGIESRAGITVLIGEAGVGKTTMVRAALEHFGADSAIVVLTNPALTRSEFLEFLGQGFRLPAGAAESKTELLTQLHRVLLELYRQNKPAALVVDEAQSVPARLLREIRLLANLETGSHKLLPIVLAGQPELAEVLNQPRFEPLKQRVAFRCTLERLTLAETASYMVQRIRSVGGDCKQLFTRGAVLTIHDRAGGVPRIINVICNNALIAGFASQERPVGQKLALEVCNHLDLSGASRADGAAGGMAFNEPTAAGLDSAAAGEVPSELLERVLGRRGQR